MLKIRQRRRAVRGRCPLLRSAEQRREKRFGNGAKTYSFHSFSCYSVREYRHRREPHMRLLVAEDEKRLNKIICEALEDEGYSVDAC